MRIILLNTLCSALLHDKHEEDFLAHNRCRLFEDPWSAETDLNVYNIFIFVHSRYTVCVFYLMQAHRI